MLANAEGPAFIPPAFDVIASLWLDEDKIADAFCSSKGVGWHEHYHRLFFVTEPFFRSGYRANLTTSWIPAWMDRAQTEARRKGGPTWVAATDRVPKSTGSRHKRSGEVRDGDSQGLSCERL